MVEVLKGEIETCYFLLFFSDTAELEQASPKKIDEPVVEKPEKSVESSKELAQKSVQQSAEPVAISSPPPKQQQPAKMEGSGDQATESKPKAATPQPTVVADVPTVPKMAPLPDYNDESVLKLKTEENGLQFYFTVSD